MSKRIKVLQLGSPSGLYGAEHWILSLIRNLDPHKTESIVAAVRDEPHLEAPLCREAEKSGFPARIFDCIGKVNFSAVRRIREYIMQNDIDIIHTHGYKTDFIGLLATRGTACRIVTTPHGWTKAPDLKLKIYEIMDRMIFPFFDAVAPLSEELERQLQIMPGLKKRLHLIQNAVDVDEVNNTDGVASEIVKLKRNNTFVIGYIGRLTSGKGLDVLLHAVKEQGQANWQVAIVGEGEQKAELQDIAENLGIRDKVNFFGFRQDRIAFLKGFDVFVLPSRSEGIPRCLMEAMTAGVPVVASDIPGCRYLVDGVHTGLLFQPDNPGELAQSIQKIESTPQLREGIVRAAQGFIDQHYSAKRMAREYEELYAYLCR